MDVLKWSTVDEKYHHLAMEGLASLFRVSLGVHYAVRNMLKFIV